jgi:hypothetical protein
MRAFAKWFIAGFLFLYLAGGILSAQEVRDKIPVTEPIPTKFGNDVIINNMPSEDQQSADLAIAFNGWLYSIYSVNTVAGGGYSCRVSKDDGLTWTDFHSYSSPTRTFLVTRVMTAGDDTTNLHVYMLLLYYDSSDDSYGLYVYRRNKNGTLINTLLNVISDLKIYDADMTNDFEDPATIATPYSVGIVYTKTEAYDSLIYVASSDGGASLSITQLITTPNYLGKVSIAFGTSFGLEAGQYLIAYEQRSSSLARNGHIYYTATAFNISAALLDPLCLDSLSVGTINLLSEPCISAQYNSSSSHMNDSSHLTALVLCTRDYNGLGTDHDIIGFYNHEAIGSNNENFARLNVNISTTNDMEPFVVFDRTFDEFHVTYYDSTDHELAYTSKGMNLTNPLTWTNLVDAYNNQPNLIYPFPVVRLYPSLKQPGFVWIAQNGPNGQAMFDAEYSTIGIPDANENRSDISVYPNPSTGKFTVTGYSNTDYTLEVFNILGAEVYSDHFPGKPEFKQVIDLSGFGGGQYFLRFISYDHVETLQIIVQ